MIEADGGVYSRPSWALLQSENAEQYRRGMRILSGGALTREMSAAQTAAELRDDQFPHIKDEAEARRLRDNHDRMNDGR